ncbi:hypothetical protein CJ030_MR4G026689 [Morella rubra]|nr:hypothetical protein CJ030_MR4G026689 [Morella rubra]
MEEHKMRYMKAYIERTKKSMEFYIQLIKEKEARVRGCYSETIQFNSDEFVKIILVDAAYIIELFLRVYFNDLDDENDSMFRRPRFLWDIGSNMILLENQLPFFILEDLYDPNKIMVWSSQHDGRPSILHLSHYFLINVCALRAIEDQHLEQYSSVECHINDYIILLSGLVFTPKDVDLLVKYEVIEKRSHINQGANPIQDLSRGPVIEYENFHFTSLCEDLNTYCRASWH